MKVLFVENTEEPPIVPDPSLVESQGFPMTVPSASRVVAAVRARIPQAVRDSGRRAHPRDMELPDVVRDARSAPRGCALRRGAAGIAGRLGARSEPALEGALRSVAEKPYFDRAAAMQALTETEAAQCRRFGIRAPVMILPNGVDLAASIGKRDKPTCGRSSRCLRTRALSVPRTCVSKERPRPPDPRVRKARSRTRDVFLLIAGHDAGAGIARRWSGLRDSRVERRDSLSRRGPRRSQVRHSALVPTCSCSASYSEGLPVAVLEAMACRCPVVVTPNCNLSEVQDREAGWLVEPTVDSVLAGLNEASRCANERRRRGENARSLVEEHFTWDRIASESIRFYLSHQHSDQLNILPGSIPVSVVILTHNEAVNIAACVRTLYARSPKSSSSIPAAPTEPSTILQRPLSTGSRAPTCVRRLWPAAQLGARPREPAHDWILFLDADERCTPKCADAIDAAIVASPGGVTPVSFCATATCFWVDGSDTAPCIRPGSFGCSRRDRFGIRKRGMANAR